MNPTSETERRIEEVADRYLSALQAGEAVDRAAVLRGHEDLGSSLDRRLALVERVFHAARRIRARDGEQTTSRIEDAEQDASEIRASSDHARFAPHDKTVLPPTVDNLAQSIPADQAVRLRCPHCGNQIQLVTPSAQEVTCVNCGSTFQVDPWGTSTYRPIRLPKQIGKFHVLEMLGRGGFGAVYKAYDTQLRRTVAIKVPRAGYFTSDEEEERFLREARHLSSLRHPGIVTVYDVARERGVPYIVSEYVDGQTLATLLVGARLSFRESAEMLAKIGDALDHAHQQKIIHRDIKPSNILIDVAGNPHVTDFGLARRDEGEVTVTLDGQVLGTPAYMSPEQAKGDHRSIDARSDVYSVGVVMYRILTGELPFRGSNRMLIQQVLFDEPRPLRRLNDRIPRDLETICLKAMAKDPARRYANARELAADLCRWLDGIPVHARPVSRLQHLGRWCRRNPTIAGLTAAVALLLITGASGASWVAWHERHLRWNAVTAQARENQQRTRAEHNAAESLQRLIRLHTMQGIQRLDEQDLLAALPWFASAMQLENGDSAQELPHRIRIANTLRFSPKLAQLLFHTEPVVHVEFGRTGDTILTASLDGTARIWDTTAGQPIHALRHAGPVHYATFSPDSQLVASASEDRTARLWHVSSGEAATPPLEHDAPVQSVAFSADGQLIATRSRDRKVRIWDTNSAAPRTPPLDHALHVSSIAFSPDGSRLIAACGNDGTGEARLWTRDGALIATLNSRAELRSAEFSPDGTRLLTAGKNGAAILWNTTTLQPIEPALIHNELIHHASFSGDGSKLVTASNDSTARVWWASTGRPATPPLKHRGIVRHAVFSPDGQYVATASHDGMVRVWDSVTGELSVPPMRQAAQVVRVAFSSDGRFVAGASYDSTTRVWDLAPCDNLEPILAHGDVVRRALFSPRGDQVATASSDGTVKIWDPQSGVLMTRPLRHPLAVLDAAFHPDAAQIATAGLDGAARLWDIGSGALVHPAFNHDGHVSSVAFSPDGRLLLTASADGTARVWSVVSGQLVTSVTHNAAVNRAVFDHSGRRFATASEDSTLRVWNTESGSPAGPAMNHEGDVRSVKFSSDDRYLISHSADATARVWDAPSGESICVLSHSHGVVSSAFVPQGRQVITTSLDGSARIWNFAEPRIALPLLSHSYPLVLHSAFSRDGQLLATSAGGRPFHFGPELPRGEPRLWTTVIAEPGVAHGEARLWDRNTGELLAPPLCHRGRVVHASFDPAGSRLATASYDHTGRIWDISPDWRPTADLFSLAQLVSAHQIDEFGGFVPATSAALRESWNSLRLKYPSSFTSSNAELAVWHRKEVMRSQQAADWRSAIRHSDQLIALRPQDPPLWAGRARAYAELDLWQDSLSDFRMAIDSGSDDEQIWCDYALATLASGDRAGYADICQRLLDQFADPIPAAAAARVMRACIVVPAAADLAALVKLADSTAKDPDNMFVLAATGAALFRAGRPDEAIGQISQAIEQSRGENVENWLFLAMAHHHAGQSQEAQRWFDRAVNWLDEPSGNLPSSATPWQDRLIRGLLRREAESMIHAKRGSQ